MAVIQDPPQMLTPAQAPAVVTAVVAATVAVTQKVAGPLRRSANTSTRRAATRRKRGPSRVVTSTGGIKRVGIDILFVKLFEA